MAKIFLSVIGTGNYDPTVYRLGNKTYKKERYVQKALLSILKERGEEFDKIIFFLTDKAKAKNWERFIDSRKDKENNEPAAETSEEKDADNNDEGLRPFLDKHFPGKYRYIKICEGKNENELLDLFNTMFNVIEEKDEITFEITHGFRFIPLLFFPVMSYAKELKNISIKNIYYGLYEKEKVSDIIDLKRYDEILNCANAAHNFRCSGNTSEIYEVITNHAKALPNSEKKIFGKYNNIAKYLDALSQALLTCQGGRQKSSIIKKAEHLMKHKEKLESSDEKEHLIFNNLILHAISSANGLLDSELPYSSGMKAVEWYIDKGLILQAYTGLRECITTFFCCIYAPEHDIDDENFRQLAIDRAITSAIPRDSNAPDMDFCLNTASTLLTNNSLNENQKKEYIAAFVKIISHINFEKVAFIQNIIEIRNHMNHFGMRKNANNVNLEDVQNHYKQTLELFHDIENRKENILTTEEALTKIYGNINHAGSVFVNFSNHPSSHWSEKQLSAARELSSDIPVIDVKFPDVSADASEEDIQNIAEIYANKITEYSPAAVMCMGEFGVCHKVVELLRSKGITTVYSCSERKAVELKTDNGIEKTSVFSFVKFRKY